MVVKKGLTLSILTNYVNERGAFYLFSFTLLRHVRERASERQAEGRDF